MLDYCFLHIDSAHSEPFQAPFLVLDCPIHPPSLQRGMICIPVLFIWAYIGHIEQKEREKAFSVVDL